MNVEQVAAPRIQSRRARVGRRVLALAIGYLLAELVVVPLVLHFVTIRTIGYLPRPMSVLAQTSKAGIVPHDYTLLLGDSNAEGQGDWMLDGMESGGRPAYHSAHLIHEWSGEDVITFGVGGAYSVTALVKNPVSRRESLRRFLVPPPRRVLAYFYEGNDLYDDVAFVRRTILRPGEGFETVDAERLDKCLARDVALLARLEGLRNNCYLPGLLQNTIKQLRKHASPEAVGASAESVDTINFARIAGIATPLGSQMQAPVLELSEEELALGLLVYERCLSFARRLYPDAEMHAVYVPAPLSCYDLACDEVEIHAHPGSRPRYPAAMVQQRSHALRERVRAIAERLSIGFVDLTPRLEALARTRLIHGPRDWKHCNAQGYECMSEEIFARVYSARN